MDTRINVIIPLYNKEDSIRTTVNSVLDQIIPKGISVSITIVNDASSDSSLSIATEIANKHETITVISNKSNSGRSATCNVGIFSKESDYCIILDADCEWDRKIILARYIDLFKSGKKLILGQLHGRPDQFWGRYYNNLNQKRRGSAHPLESATSANFGCWTKYLNEIGGFCTEYNCYGFEDRDLFLTLQKIPIPRSEIAHDSVISALNTDNPRISSIAQKLRIAGRCTAPIFHRRHPEEYSRSQYFSFDMRTKPYFIVLAVKSASPLIELTLRLSYRIFDSSLTSHNVKSMLVKVCIALSFTLGSIGY